MTSGQPTKSNAHVVIECAGDLHSPQSEHATLPKQLLHHGGCSGKLLCLSGILLALFSAVALTALAVSIVALQHSRGWRGMAAENYVQSGEDDNEALLQVSKGKISHAKFA